jgi:putative endonuclease
MLDGLTWSKITRPGKTPPPPPRGDSAALGRWGENYASHFLRREGFRILYRNFRAKGGGEVDLVCRDVAEATLVFVEVKTRWNEDHGRPFSAVDRTKQDLIIRGACAWLRLLDNPEIPFRFDVLEILASPQPLANLIRDAFHLPDNTIY